MASPSSVFLMLTDLSGQHYLCILPELICLLVLGSIMPPEKLALLLCSLKET